MNPLVSILIPAYNAERWLADTLRSALAQTWARKEIIVVDDSSTDGTLAVAQRFVSAGVRVVSQKNAGAAAARNHAYALCQGDYIQWLDADDLLSPDKITRQMQAAAALGPQTLLSCGWGFFCYRPQRAKFAPSLLWEKLTPQEWLLRKWEHNLFMQTGTWLTSRALSDAAGAWDPRMMGDDDGEYFFRVIRQSGGIHFVPDARVYYRVAGTNRLSYISRSDKKMEAQWLGMQVQIGYLRGLADDARTRAAVVTYLQNWLINFYPGRMDLVAAAQQLAAELGGQLSLPQLSWKYRWIQKAFGWPTARAAQVNYNEWKSSALRSWDRVMFQVEGGRAE